MDLAQAQAQATDLTQAMGNLSVVTQEELIDSLSSLSYDEFIAKFTKPGIVSRDDPYFKGIFGNQKIFQNFIGHINKVLADNSDDDTFIKLFICLSVSINARSTYLNDPSQNWYGFIQILVLDHGMSEEHGNLLCNYPEHHDVPEKVAIAIPVSSDEAAATMVAMAGQQSGPERPIPTPTDRPIPASTMATMDGMDGIPDPVFTFDSPPSTPKGSNNSKYDENVPPQPLKSSVKNGKFEVESDSVDNAMALFHTAADHDYKITEKQEEELTKRTTKTEEETTKRTETVELTKRTVAGETTKQMDLKVKALQLENEQLKLKAELKQPAPPPMIPPPSIPPPSASSYSQQPAAMIPPSLQQQPAPNQPNNDFFTPNGEEWQTIMEIDGTKKSFPRKDRFKKQYLAPVQCIGDWDVAGNVKTLGSHPLKPKTKTFSCSCKEEHEHKARLRIVQLPKADGTTSYIFQRHKFDFLHRTGEPISAPAGGV